VTSFALYTKACKESLLKDSEKNFVAYKQYRQKYDNCQSDEEKECIVVEELTNMILYEAELGFFDKLVRSQFSNITPAFGKSLVR